MSQFIVKPSSMTSQAGQLQASGRDISRISGSVRQICGRLSIESESRQVLQSRLMKIAESIDLRAGETTAMSDVLAKALYLYEKADKGVTEINSGTIVSKQGTTISMSASQTAKLNPTTRKNSFKEEFVKEYGWDDFVKSFGNAGKAVTIPFSIAKATTWNQWANVVLSTAKTGKKIYTDIKNYSKIGRAIGGKNAASYFVKKALGFRNVGHASTCKNPLSRFYNNLHNTTSPYNLKEAFAPLTGKKGTFSTVAAWAGVALTGAMNAIDNIQEQKNSGGTMSTGRVVAETITETAIDTIVTYGATAVVGAAITAATGVVAAPVVVAIATGVGIAAINAGVKAATGKSATEIVSDGILDLGKGAIDIVGKGARKAKSAIASWTKGMKTAFGW